VTWLLAIIVVLLAFDLVVRVYYVAIVLRIFETKPPFSVNTFPPDPMAEPIEFTTSHGLTLRGSLYHLPERTPRGLILFCPENRRFTLVRNVLLSGVDRRRICGFVIRFSWAG